MRSPETSTSVGPTRPCGRTAAAARRFRRPTPRPRGPGSDPSVPDDGGAAAPRRLYRRVRRRPGAGRTPGAGNERVYRRPTVSESALPVSRRDEILVAAEELFAQNGFSGTSLNDIAEVVGIRRPTLLHHFPSKEALYREVFERALTEWYERVQAATDQPTQGWDRVDGVITAGLRVLRGQPQLRAHRAPGVPRGRVPPRHGPRRGPAPDVPAGDGLLPTGDGRRSLPGARSRAAPPVRATARCSATSPTPRSWSGMLGRDPLSDEALAVRLEHVRRLLPLRAGTLTR